MGGGAVKGEQSVLTLTKIILSIVPNKEDKSKMEWS